jgi:hypothetical protein
MWAYILKDRLVVILYLRTCCVILYFSKNYGR